jgi:hypothetical protein
MRIGTDVGRRLRDAALLAGDAQAEADADLIIQTARCENFTVAPDVVGEFGELFDALFTKSVLSSSRLCPSYVARSASKSRKRVGAVIHAVEKLPGERWWLATLTMPTLIGAGVELSFDIFDDALSRLRKGKWWKDKVRAALKGEEFTLGDSRRLESEGRAWDFEQDGYHVHAHVMSLAVEIGWSGLGEQWKRCLLRAAQKFDVAMEFKTKHGRPVVDVRLVTTKRQGKRTISEEGAIFEVCKYMVKGSEFSKVPASQLLEVERTLRGRRMVELWGDLNNRKGSEGGARVKRESDAIAGHAAPTIEDRLNALYGNAEVDHARGIDDMALWQQARGELYVCLELEPETSAALLTRTAYLDEREQLTARAARGSPLKVQKRRARPLRLIGAQMIAEGRRIEWKEMLLEVARQRREWRESDLIRRFPHNVFRGLDGSMRYGLCVNPATAFESGALYGHRVGLKTYLEDRASDIAKARYKTRASSERFERRQRRVGLDWQCSAWARADAEWETYVNGCEEGEQAGREKSWQAWYAIEGERRKSRLAVT